MKIYFASLLTVLGIPAASAFLASQSCNTCSSITASPTTTLFATSLEEEFATAFDKDDFYADYNPARYDSRDNDDNNNSFGGYDNRPSRPRNSGRGGGRGGRGRGGRGRGGRGRGRGGQSRQPKDYLGPNGHDYELTSDAGPNNSKFDERSIHALLAARLQAKFSRDFRTADMIQMELIDGGVFVHDGMKEWRADGIPYGSFNGGGSGRNNPRSLEGQHYSKSEYSADVVNDDVVNNELITKLVKERTKFKMMHRQNKSMTIN